MKAKVKEWFLGKALKKVASQVAIFAVAIVAAVNAKNLGVNINIDPDVLAGSVFAGLQLLRNFLKTKYNVDWL